MNIIAKGLIKTVIVGGIGYAAGKVITLAKLVNACRCCPDDVMEEIGSACEFWKKWEKFDIDNKEQEETAPEIVQVTSAAEEEKAPEENQPED